MCIKIKSVPLTSYSTDLKKAFSRFFFSESTLDEDGRE
jgi:hypothetical protein